MVRDMSRWMEWAVQFSLCRHINMASCLKGVYGMLTSHTHLPHPFPPLTHL